MLVILLKRDFLKIQNKNTFYKENLDTTCFVEIGRYGYKIVKTNSKISIDVSAEYSQDCLVKFANITKLE